MVYRVKGKIKTSIVIDKDLWELFKAKASSKKGLKGVSMAVEEALEDGLSEKVVAEALGKMLSEKGKITELDVKPVKPKTATSAGKAIGELRAQQA